MISTQKSTSLWYIRWLDCATVVGIGSSPRTFVEACAYSGSDNGCRVLKIPLSKAGEAQSVQGKKLFTSFPALFEMHNATDQVLLSTKHIILSQQRQDKRREVFGNDLV